MSLLVEGFKIGAEFAFDTTLASAQVGTLQGKVDSLSSSVENALISAQTFGLNFFASFTGLGGGVLGLFGSAIKASDAFTQSQLKLVNVLSANKDYLQGPLDNFIDQGKVAKNIMKDIAEDATRFGLNQKELFGMTSLMGTFLMPKGMAGDNLSSARDISRNFLKSAPTLGVDAGQSQGQLFRAMQGGASMGDTLFKRLFFEAGEAFKAKGVTDSLTAAKQFNKLDFKSRFEILNTAMAKFSSNIDVLDGRANSLTGVIQRLSNIFTGMGSILVPLGDAILKPLLQLANYAIFFLQTKGEKIVKTFAGVLDRIFENPKKLLIDLMQIKELSKDVGSAAGISSMVFGIIHIKELISFLGKTNVGAAILGPINSLVTKTPILGKLLTGLSWGISRVTSFIGGSSGFFSVIFRIAGLFGFLTVVFQAFSRAMAKAKVNTFLRILTSMDTFSDTISRLYSGLTDIFSPLEVLIDGLSEFFLLFIPATSNVEVAAGALAWFADIMEGVGKVIRTVLGVVMGALSGAVTMLMPIISILTSAIESIAAIATFGMVGDVENPFKNFMENNSGYLDDIMDDALGAFDKFSGTGAESLDRDGKKFVAKNNVNFNGDININNDFKESHQPDRIAFTMKDQLQKMAQNKTGYRSKTANALMSGF